MENLYNLNIVEKENVRKIVCLLKKELNNLFGIRLILLIINIELIQIIIENIR